MARRHAERDVEAVGVPAGRQPEPSGQFGQFGQALGPDGPLNWKRRSAAALGLLILAIVLIVESIGKLQTTEVAVVYDTVNKKVSACGRRAGRRSGGLTDLATSCWRTRWARGCTGCRPSRASSSTRQSSPTTRSGTCSA